MEEESNSLTQYRFVIVGNPRVGKTSIKRSYFGSEFINNYRMKLGEEPLSKDFDNYSVTIWDLGSSQHGSQMLLDDYLKGAHGALIVFDIADRSTFTKATKWVDFINRKASRGVGEIPKIIVGNKVDLRGSSHAEIDKDQADLISQRLSHQSIYEIPYIESSAKTGFNIDYLFAYLISIIETTDEV